MAVPFRTIQSPLHKEAQILDSLIYRSKNQHKSSLILRKMTQLKRLLRISKLTPAERSRIATCAKGLYTVASSSLAMGHFIPLSLCVLGASARIFYLIEKCQVENERNAIDEIFNRI